MYKFAQKLHKHFFCTFFTSCYRLQFVNGLLHIKLKWSEDVKKLAFDNIWTSNVLSTFDIRHIKHLFMERKIVGSHCYNFSDLFHMYKVNSIGNSNKSYLRTTHLALGLTNALNITMHFQFWAFIRHNATGAHFKIWAIKVAFTFSSHSNRFGNRNLCLMNADFDLLYHITVLHCFFQDPAVLQALSAQQHEPQIADATSSTAATTATLPTPQSQVTGFTYCIMV